MSDLQIALNLSRLGYYVHPLAPRNKIPIAAHGYNDATRDEDTIRQWWKDEPTANVGYNLHKSGLVDIAPDCKEWAERFKANGMPPTTEYTSGNGQHTLYRLPKGGPIARVCVKGQYDIMSEGNAVAPGSIHPNGSTYTLLTDLRAVEDLPPAPQWAIDMLQQHVKAARNEHAPEDWAALPSGATLAHSRRFQALCKVNAQLRAVCAGEAITLITKHGAPDNSVSIQRSIFVNQLLRAKYPENEIRALANHFSGVLESNPKWFETDIDRLIDIYKPKDYAPESTGVLQVAPRGGRHYEITAGELLDRYHEYADIGINGLALDWTVTEAADRLGVSTGTIKRREAELTEQGQIKRLYGVVILSPETWEIRSQRIKTPYIEDAPLEQAIGSQLDTPQQDAPNAPDMPVCIKDRAHAEVTHPPAAAANLPTPDRALLTRVRTLARKIAEPGWFLRDYDVLTDAELRAEEARLRAADEWAAADMDADEILAKWQANPRWHRVDPDVWERTQAVMRGPDVAEQHDFGIGLGPPSVGERVLSNPRPPDDHVYRDIGYMNRAKPRDQRQAVTP